MRELTRFERRRDRVNSVFAGAIAAIFSFIEIRAGLKRPMSLRASHWVGVRVVLDFAVGFLAYHGVNAAAGSGAYQPLVIAISGARNPTAKSRTTRTPTQW